MAGSSKSIRLVLDMDLPSGESESEICSRVADVLGCLSPTRVISSSISDPNDPDPAVLRDNLTHHLLSILPSFCVDDSQNSYALRLLAETLGSALVYPLYNEAPGSRDGEKILQQTLRAVEEVAYKALERVQAVETLKDFEPSGQAN